jgi:hypothetical protein
MFVLRLSSLSYPLVGSRSCPVRGRNDTTAYDYTGYAGYAVHCELLLPVDLGFSTVVLFIPISL